MSNVERDPVYLAAADWFARLREPEVSVEQMLAWQRWMTQDNKHAQAFEQIEQVSATLRLAKRPTPASPAQEARDRYDGSTPLGAWRAPAFRLPLAIAASIAVAGLTVALMMLQKTSPDVLRTAVGENRTVKLADGSSVVLGGNTELEVTFDGKLRHLGLTRGEAFFTVAKDPSRPFKVEAGDTTVIAVGTEFNVRRGADQTVVAVLEGRVIVESDAANTPLSLLRGSRRALSPVPVIAGEQTTVSAAGIAAPSASANPAAAIAWQSGRLAFQLESLNHVLEDVNRYAPKPVVLEDESVGNLRITATVVRGNVGGLITSIERAFGLRAVEERDRIVLRPGQAH